MSGGNVAACGGESLPADGKLPPWESCSALLDVADLRAGFGLASFNAPANVESFRVERVDFSAVAEPDVERLISG